MSMISTRTISLCDCPSQASRPISRRTGHDRHNGRDCRFPFPTYRNMSETLTYPQDYRQLFAFSGDLVVSALFFPYECYTLEGSYPN